MDATWRWKNKQNESIYNQPQNLRDMKTSKKKNTTPKIKAKNSWHTLWACQSFRIAVLPHVENNSKYLVDIILASALNKNVQNRRKETIRENIKPSFSKIRVSPSQNQNHISQKTIILAVFLTNMLKI